MLKVRQDSVPSLRTTLLKFANEGRSMKAVERIRPLFKRHTRYLHRRGFAVVRRRTERIALVLHIGEFVLFQASYNDTMRIERRCKPLKFVEVFSSWTRFVQVDYQYPISELVAGAGVDEETLMFLYPELLDLLVGLRPRLIVFKGISNGHAIFRFLEPDYYTLYTKLRKAGTPGVLSTDEVPEAEFLRDFASRIQSELDFELWRLSG